MDSYNNYMNLQGNIEKEKKYIGKNFHFSQTHHFKDSPKQKENYSRNPCMISTNRYTKLVEKQRHPSTFKGSISNKTLLGKKSVGVLCGATEKENNDIFQLTSNYIRGNNAQFNYFNHNCHYAYNKNQCVAKTQGNKNRPLVTYDQNRWDMTEREWKKKQKRKNEGKQNRKQEREREREREKEQEKERDHEKVIENVAEKVTENVAEKVTEKVAEKVAEKELHRKGNLTRKDANGVENLKREDFYSSEDSLIEKDEGEDILIPTEKCIDDVSFHDSWNLKKCSFVNQQNETDYKQNDDLFLKRKRSIPLETEEEMILNDLYFDIHMDDEKKQETEQKKDDHRSLAESLKQNDSEDRQILVDHIKRVEHQNEIFLNNLLNMYYVCMDYIKLQDKKIKEKEQIILELEEQIHQKDKIINILQKKNDGTYSSPFYAHANTEFVFMHKK